MKIADEIEARAQAEFDKAEAQPDGDALSPAARLIQAAAAGLKAMEEESPECAFIVIGAGPDNWTCSFTQTMEHRSVARMLNMVLGQALSKA